MFYFCKNNKINKYEKNIICKEFYFEQNKKFDTNELDKFYKKFNHYVLTSKILYTNPTFYSTLMIIQLDQSKDQTQYINDEIIWKHEHYDFIEDLRTIEIDFDDLVHRAYGLKWISKIQFKLAKKIMRIIPNIFYFDSIFEKLYIDDSGDKIQLQLPTQTQLNYYFNIIEIIILKMYYCNKNKTNKKKKCIDSILLDPKYIKSITNLKNQLQSELFPVE